MGILLELVIGLISLASGSLVISSPLEKVFKTLFDRMGLLPAKKEVPYSEKLDGLTANMMKASKEMDALLEQLEKTTKERKEAMAKVESEMVTLQTREKELKERIAQLKDVPLPAVEEFAKLTHSGETRSARRDYVLFGAGVVVSTGIAILLKVLGLG